MQRTTTPPAVDNYRLGGELSIHRLGLGAMRLARSGWNGPARDPETGRAVLRRAIELGVNHIDTADFYRSGDGAVRANTLIREALHPYPSDLAIATKVGPIIGPSGPSQAGAADLRALVEDNIKSLRVDCLDLVYLRIGLMTPPRWNPSPSASKSSRRCARRASSVISGSVMWIPGISRRPVPSHQSLRCRTTSMWPVAMKVWHF